MGNLACQVRFANVILLPDIFFVSFAFSGFTTKKAEVISRVMALTIPDKSSGRHRMLTPHLAEIGTSWQRTRGWIPHSG